MPKKLLQFLFIIFVIESFSNSQTWAGEQDSLKIYVPDGWVDVSSQVKQSNTEGIPTYLVNRARRDYPKEIRIWADPKTFKDKLTVTVGLGRVLFPDDMCRQLIKDDMAFENLRLREMENIKKFKILSVEYIESSVVNVNGVKTIREVTRNHPKAGKIQSKIFSKSLCYRFLYHRYFTFIDLTCPVDKWEEYLPIFENIAAKSIKNPVN